MSSLLQSVTVESCQTTTLRDRRHSSIRPPNFLPRIFSAGDPTHGLEESAVADEPSTFDPPAITSPLPRSSNHTEVLPLSPLSDAHMSGYSTNITAPRHHDSRSSLNTYAGTSPTSNSPGFESPTELSRQSSLHELRDDAVPAHPNLERMKLRLASAFFVYFLCGWGDGGESDYTLDPYFGSLT